MEGQAKGEMMLLEVKGLRSGYGGKEILHGIFLKIDKSELVGLFGHNGAGKTTAVSTILGHIKATAGSILLNGQEISDWDPSKRVSQGISLVPQGNNCFSELSVAENLRMGSYLVREASLVNEQLKNVYRIFPILEKRKSQLGGLLSGGEQQMLGMAIGMMSRPKLMLLDEPTLGLAPTLVERVMETVQQINRDFGISILLVEQNVGLGLSVTQRAYFMKLGEIVVEDSSEKLASRGSFWDLF